MNTNITRRQAMALMAGAASASAAGPAFAQASELRFSSFEPPVAWVTSRVLKPWAEEVSKASNGTLNINLFPGGALGKNPAQQLKLVQDGVADIAWIVLGLTPGRFDDTDVVTLPYLTDTSAETSRAMWNMYARGEFDGFDEFKVLCIGATPSAKLHGTGAIKGVEDINGKRIRANGSHLVEVVKRLGGVPVTMSGGQVAESLSRGLLDQVIANFGFVGDFKVNEVATEHLIMPMGATAVMVAMRKDKFNALPEAARKAIDAHSGEAMSLRLGKEWDLQETEFMERITKSGKNNARTPDADELAKWKAAIEPINAEWRKAKPKNEKLYQSIVAELTKIRGGK